MKLRSEHTIAAQVALTMIGTIIGAGFASGQEVLRFFVVFGGWGVVGVAVAGLLLLVLSQMVIVSAARYKVTSHRQLLAHTVTQPVGKLIDTALTGLLLVSTSVMLAGAGAVVEQQLGQSQWVGTIGMSVLVVAAASRRVRGVMLLNLVLVPFLTLAFLYLGTAAVMEALPNRLVGLWTAPPMRYSRTWWAAALLYPCYNMFLAISGLSTVGGTLSVVQARKGAFLGSIGVTVLLACAAAAIWESGPAKASVPVPILSIAFDVSPWFGILYSMAILTAMLTTATVNVYGMARRLGEKTPQYHFIVVLVVVLAALPLSRLGFVQAVGTAYPLIGYGAMAFFIFWLFLSARTLWSRRSRFL